MVVKSVKKTWQIRKYQPFFASKTWFPFIMFMKHADGCSEHNTYQMKWVLTWIFGMSTFCSNYSSTSLWHGVSIFPENFTLILFHAFCNTSQWLSFECTIDLSSLFSNSCWISCWIPTVVCLIPDPPQKQSHLTCMSVNVIVGRRQGNST